MLGRLRRSALLLHQLQHKTPNHSSQSPKIDLVTRQGGGALFSSDVFIEDRVAAGVVGGEDVLLATAVDLMMARDCEGALGCSAVFVGAYASSCFLYRMACSAYYFMPPQHSLERFPVTSPGWRATPFFLVDVTDIVC